jgi:hypothetical protein
MLAHARSWALITGCCRSFSIGGGPPKEPACFRLTSSAKLFLLTASARRLVDLLVAGGRLGGADGQVAAVINSNFTFRRILQNARAIHRVTGVRDGL